MDCGKKGRVGAAAAAEQMDAQRKVLLQGLREYFRGNMVSAGLRVGQTGIRLQEDGQGGGFPKLAGQRKQLLRAERAVEADGICAQALNHRRHRRDAAAGEGSSVCFEGHGNQQRKRLAELFTGFLDRKDGGLDLIEIGHRFHDDEVNSGGNAGSGLFLKEGVGVLKAQCSGGFEQLADWPDVQRNQRISSGGSCILHRSKDDLFRGISAGGQLAAVGTEGIGVQNFCSCRQIVLMHRRDHLGVGQVEQLGLGSGRHTALLQLGSHRTVHQPEAVAAAQRIN